MKLTQETLAIGSATVVILGTIGTGFWLLDANQTEMEARLSKDISQAEERLAQRISQVDGRLEKVDIGLRTVEGETTTLAGVEARLTSTIESSETRLSQGLQDVEKRLTAQIDKIDDRLLEVEGESARLTAIVKSNWTASDLIWSDIVTGKVQPVANVDDLEALKGSKINVQFHAMPAFPYRKGAFIQAYNEALRKHPEFAKAYAQAVLKSLGLPNPDDAEQPPQGPIESE